MYRERENVLMLALARPVCAHRWFFLSRLVQTVSTAGAARPKDSAGVLEGVQGMLGGLYDMVAPPLGSKVCIDAPSIARVLVCHVGES